jgi:hypothetical protein
MEERMGEEGRGRVQKRNREKRAPLLVGRGAGCKYYVLG